MSDQVQKAVEAMNRSAQSWLDLANFCQGCLDHLNGTKTPIITLESIKARAVPQPQPETTPNVPEEDDP
jgi:hypothetical protein